MALVASAHRINWIVFRLIFIFRSKIAVAKLRMSRPLKNGLKKKVKRLKNQNRRVSGSIFGLHKIGLTMKLQVSISVILLLLSFSLASAQDKKPTKTAKYCSIVGPLELTFVGDSVVGRYLITVAPEEIPGTLKGKLTGALFDGWWSDKDGRERIILGFNPTFTQFHGIYAAVSKPGDWNNHWRGVKLENLTEIPEDQRKWFRCEWKK